MVSFIISSQGNKLRKKSSICGWGREGWKLSETGVRRGRKRKGRGEIAGGVVNGLGKQFFANLEEAVFWGGQKVHKFSLALQDNAVDENSLEGGT